MSSGGYPETNGFRLELTTCSGKKMVKEILYAKGHPQNPMTDKEIEAKFRRLAGPVMGAQHIGPALDRLWHLEEIEDLHQAISLLELP
jgi:2-methylcitrate dehydratase